MLQTLETKLEKFPGMEEKTYKRWFPSTPTEMPVEAPRELPNNFPTEFPLRENILNTLDSFRMECYGFVNNTNPNPRMTIRNMPASGVQVHIHEGEGGTGHLKTHKGEYYNLNSYDAAMLDNMLDKFNYPKYTK